MKYQYELTSMVHRVHKNVKYMISEARQIIKAKNRVPIPSGKPQIYIEDVSSSNPQQNSKKSITPSVQQSSFEKYGKMHSRERHSSLMSQNLYGICPEMKLSNKFQNPSKQKLQEIKLLSFLNKQEAELVESSRKLLNESKKVKQTGSILPSLMRRRRGRSTAEAESKDYFSISVETLEELNASKMKRFNTIEAASSSNLLSYLQKNKLKRNPFKIKRKQKLKEIMDNFDDQCEPWKNSEVENDPIFQL